MSNVLALTVDGSRPMHHIPVELVAVIGDHRGRVLFTHAGYPDVWSLPSAALEPGLTPHESLRKAGAIDDSETGELMGVWSHGSPPASKSVASVSGRLLDERLLVAYRFLGGTDQPQSGFYLPIGLAPLNTEPSHLAIAGAVRRTTSPDRLELPTGIDHLAKLRREEVVPEIRSDSAPSMVNSVNWCGSPNDGGGSWRRPREVDALIAAFDGSQGGGDMLRSILATQGVDEATVLRCELRLEEIESDHGVFPIAWSRLSTRTGNGGRFLDLILAHLGYASLRRHRGREADAYLRRALAICEVPHRRAAIKYSLSWRAAGPAATG